MSRRLAPLRHFVLWLMVFFLLVLGYALYKLLDLQNEISLDVGENMVWSVSQSVYQSNQLALAQGVQPPTAQSREAVELHRDLLKANLEMLLQGPNRRFMQRAAVVGEIEQLSVALEQPDLDYAPLPKQLRSLGNRVMLLEREDAGARRDADRALLFQVISAVLGMLLAGALLCWQLLGSLKQAKQANQEVVQQHMQTRALLDSLQHERSARMRYRDFVSLMSHQLRTPLAVIDSTAQRLKRQLSEPGHEVSVEERSQRIRSSVNHLNHLISRVLEGLRLDEGINSHPLPLSLERQRYAWQALLESALERFGDLLQERQVRINSGAEVPAQWVECDRIWCIEILCNLISNAHKYSPIEQPIELSLMLAEGHVQCHVRDYGPGIPEADLELVFQRFYRAHNTQHVAGIGLGLPIARTLAQWHGGSLVARNAAGGGALLVLSLPQPPAS
jgi:signal transduction histidine kinase